MNPLGDDSQYRSRSTDAPAAENDQPPNGILIGPSKAGKTQFALAVNQACNSQVEGEPVLRMVIENENMATLVSQAADLMFDGRKLESTVKESTQYRFSIRGYKGYRQGEPVDFIGEKHLVYDDGPGRLMFPDETKDPEQRRATLAWQHNLAISARQAEFLILCVDATARNKIVLKRLPKVLLDMQREMDISPPERRPPLGWFDRARGVVPQQYSSRRLNFDRVLLLLNKVDILAWHASRALKVIENIRECAQLLDPVEHARRYFSPQFLTMFRSAMKPGSKLAVGLCSAGGFFDDGDHRPFLKEGGSVATPDTGDRIDLLRRWRPYGVREALYFAAFGKESDTVKILRDEDMFVGSGQSPSLVANLEREEREARESYE